MKPTLIVFLAVLFCTCNITSDKKTISISDYRESKIAPEIDASKHKNGDIQIFRMPVFFMESVETYTTIIYRNDNGELNGYKSYVGSDDEYDKATVIWDNDSTVSVKLFNSESGQSESFSMGGKGSKTWLSTDD